MHGTISNIKHDEQGCFAKQANPFKATRYHSLIVDKASLPNDDLIVTAVDLGDNYIMGLRHKTSAIESLQFHPESIATESGIRLFENFVKRYC